MKKKNSGFTLLETILYLALFSIVIGGGMIATYEIIEATNASKNKVTLQEEANFVLRKINWILTGATAVSAPSTTSLVATKSIAGTSTPLTVNLVSGDLTLQRTSASASVINSSSVRISNLVFTKTTGTGGKPDSLSTSFTLTTAENGRVASQGFSTIKYLR